MPNPTPGALSVRAKTNHVVDYHYDEERPGKPLYLLIPGGLIALGALALIVYLAYSTWLDGSLDAAVGIPLMLLLAPVYIGGVFLFCYGYETYDLGKATRDTAIIVFITVAAVVILAVLFVAAGAIGKSGRSKSKSSGSRSAPVLTGTSGSGGLGNFVGGFGPIVINSSSPTHTVTREVVHEVPVAPPAPQPISCPNCGRSYIPAETHFACPNCGAPTPPDLAAPDAPPLSANLN